MKLLLLLRHAESSEKMQGETDHERTLTSKGVQQVSAVATFMKDKSLTPETVISSDAVRARTTAELLGKQSSKFGKTILSDRLYEADTQTYINLVRRAGECQSLMLVGHNPAISTFASYISKTRIASVGTANLLVFQFKGSEWSALGKGQCELMEHFAP